MSLYGMGSYGEYRPTSSSGSSGPGQVLDTVGEKVGSVGDKVSGAGETVGNKVSGVGETVGSAASQVTGGVGSAAGQVSYQARTSPDRRTQMISENALAAGAIAVAAGAAIGLLLPATETERRVMGDAGSKAIDTAKATVSDTLSKAEGAPA